MSAPWLAECRATRDAEPLVGTCPDATGGIWGVGAEAAGPGRAVQLGAGRHLLMPSSQFPFPFMPPECSEQPDGLPDGSGVPS